MKRSGLGVKSGKPSQRGRRKQYGEEETRPMGCINVSGKRCNFFFIYDEIETKPMVTERWYVMDLPFVHLATLQDKRSLNHHLTVSFFFRKRNNKTNGRPE
jgi:hypothetical protein